MSCTGGYAFGDCTYGAALLAPWIPCGLGNAIDWLSNARAKGLPTGSAPEIGAVVVYGSDPPLYSSLGHCGVVIGVLTNGEFTVREMNFYGDGGGFDVYDDRVSTMTAVEGFIYPPSTYGPPLPAPGQPAGRTVSKLGLAPTLLVLGGAAALAGFGWYTHPELGARLRAEIVHPAVAATDQGTSWIRAHL